MLSSRRIHGPIVILTTIAALGQTPSLAHGQNLDRAVIRDAAFGRQDDPPAKRNAMQFMKAIGVVADSVLKVGEKLPLGYDDGLSLFGAFIQGRAATTLERTFESGTDYAILGGGDEDAIDIDLEVRDASGKLIVQDDDLDAAPVVIFRPRATGVYRIKLSLDKTSANGSFCAMAIMRRGGWNVPADNMVLACGKSMVSYVRAYELMDGLKFHDSPNQWSFFGGILRKGQQHGLKNIALGKGQRVIIAAADNHASDIDLFLKDANQRILAKDDEEDAVPFLRIQAQSSLSYKLELVNAESDSPSMVVAVIMSK